MLRYKRQRLCLARSLKRCAVWCLRRVRPTWVKELWKEIVDYRTVKACLHGQCRPFLKQRWQLINSFQLVVTLPQFCIQVYKLSKSRLRETASLNFTSRKTQATSPSKTQVTDFYVGQGSHVRVKLSSSSSLDWDTGCIIYCSPGQRRVELSLNKAALF